MFKLQTNTKHLIVYFYDDGLAILHIPSSSLYALEGLGCWIFLGLDQGLDEKALIIEYLKEYPNGNLSVLKKHIETIKPLFLENSNDNQYRHEYRAILDTDYQSSLNKKYSYIKINEICVAIADKESIIIPALKNLVIDNPNGDSILCYIEIESTGNFFSIMCNGKMLHTNLLKCNIFPELIDFIQILYYQSLNYLIAIHSGVLSKNNFTLIMPGISGSGKSTLCAQLAKHDFYFHSDEVAVLLESNLIASIPLPIAIKSGSWSVLKKIYSNIDTLAIWQRLDGRYLKYLFLNKQKKDLEPKQVLVIFPHHNQAYQSAELISLTPTQSLQKINIAGYQIKGTLDQYKAEKILDFFKSAPAFDLYYSSFEQAYQKINHLMVKYNNE